MRAKRPAKPTRRSRLMKAVSDHPVAAAGIAGSAILGAVLVRKALKSPAKGAARRTSGPAADEVVRTPKSKRGKPKR